MSRDNRKENRAILRDSEKVTETGFRQGILARAKKLEEEFFSKALNNSPSKAEALPLAYQEVCFRLAVAENQNAELRARSETTIFQEALPGLVEARATILRIEAGRFAQSKGLDPEEALYESKHGAEVAQYLSQRAAAAEIALENRRNVRN